MSNTKNNPALELIILEELFLDQLAFKLQATLSLQPLPKSTTKAIESFGKELERLTHENIELFKQSI